ncbi:MAG: hypothetical protein K6E95_03630 [Lachnospiraceae bacterium]|nr:hypothetical protein [Lachnospiraceae bacterium]
MALLKYLTGLFAVFLVTLFPMMLRAEDICEESRNRVECAVEVFTDEVADEREINAECVKRLTQRLAVEPDVYEITITVAVCHMVLGGEKYHAEMEHDLIMRLLERGESVVLNEGDTVTVGVRAVSPSIFSKITGRFTSERKKDAGQICMGCRIGRGSEVF